MIVGFSGIHILIKTDLRTQLLNEEGSQMQICAPRQRSEKVRISFEENINSEEKIFSANDQPCCFKDMRVTFVFAIFV